MNKLLFAVVLLCALLFVSVIAQDNTWTQQVEDFSANRLPERQQLAVSIYTVLIVNSLSN
jgi:hypothetical protein